MLEADGLLGSRLMKKILRVLLLAGAFQCVCNADVTVYKDINYGGASIKYGVGAHNYNEIRRNNPGDDDISSVKIDPGYRVILYWDPNYKGRSLVLTRDTPNFLIYGANDQTSSLRVEKIAVNGLFKRWTSAGYTGSASTWKLGEYKSVNGDFASIFVPKGFSVTLFSKQNFAGNVIALRAQDSDIWIDELKPILSVVKSLIIEKNE